jgi:cell division protein ZapA
MKERQMPEVQINIGGRSFEVACQEGEEHYLLAAAKMLDTEASTLVDQIGRVPEARMLLMAGLMLADRTAGVEDKLRELEDQISNLKSDLAEAQARPADRVEVPVLPEGVIDSLAEIAARAEALANEVEEASS